MDLSAPITIGNVTLRNRAFLAPMSGVTDVPFRKLAWELGAGLVVSEMVASQALVGGHEEMQLKMQSADIPLHVVQLAGREAHWMELAAKIAQSSGAQIIDINMGCPARRVTTGYSGSALMRDLDHALCLIKAVINAVEVPVTLKMRLGWDHSSINAPELAKRAQDAGVQMITVHGRTRCQFYKGEADWNAIQAVRDATDLPLVVNGDIVDSKTADSALAACNADATMIGRGAYGKPWLPGVVAGNVEPNVAIDADFVSRHHEDMLVFYGYELGIRQARKHLGWYLEQISNQDVPRELKKELMTSCKPVRIYQIIQEVFQASATSVSGLKLLAA